VERWSERQTVKSDGEEEKEERGKKERWKEGIPLERRRYRVECFHVEHRRDKPVRGTRTGGGHRRKTRTMRIAGIQEAADLRDFPKRECKCARRI